MMRYMQVRYAVSDSRDTENERGIKHCLDM
jgi:hypothetical protein